MSASVNSALEFQQKSTPNFHATRPFLWSIRRELWEFRSIYLAPIGVAVLVLISFLISMNNMGRQMRNVAAFSPMELDKWIQRPYNFAAMFLMGISFVVAIFYCLEAMQTERRDRSILFWKSLPVSDMTAVLSKLSIPMLVLPLIVLALTIVTNIIMVLLNGAVLIGTGNSPELLEQHLPLGQMWMMQAYHMFVLHGLWLAPVYGWLLVVSAWARRLAFLWAVLPLVGIGVVEKVLFNSTYFATWLWDRFGGAPAANAYPGGAHALHAWSQLHAGEVLFSAGLWTGIVFAGLCVVLASRLRRSRDPM